MGGEKKRKKKISIFITSPVPNFALVFYSAILIRLYSSRLLIRSIHTEGCIPPRAVNKLFHFAVDKTASLIASAT